MPALYNRNKPGTGHVPRFPLIMRGELLQYFHSSRAEAFITRRINRVIYKRESRIRERELIRIQLFFYILFLLLLVSQHRYIDRGFEFDVIIKNKRGRGFSISTEEDFVIFNVIIFCMDDK